ncbi:MAG: ATP-binding protein [Planctomycetota bacterium]
MIAWAALDALEAHIAILDRHGVIRAVNAAWKRFALDNGYADAAFGIGTSYLDACASAGSSNAGDGVRTADGIREVLRGERESFYLEYPCHAPDEERWFQMRVSRPAPATEQVAAIVTHENITRATRDERARRDRVEALSAASDAAVGQQFAEAVAHELNQPLASISGYLQGVLNLLGSAEADRARVLEGVRAAAHESERAGEIIRAIRRLTKGGSAESREHDLREIAWSTSKLLERATTDASIDLRVSVPQQPIRARVDEIQLQQALVNLLHNAVRAIRTGREQHGAIALSLARAGSAARFEVEDNGPGFPDDVLLEQLFDPLVSHTPGGLGLGLSIARSLVESNGGQIGADRVPRGGARIWFTLPLSSESPTSSRRDGGCD